MILLRIKSTTVKFIARLSFTFPLVALTFLLLKLNLANNGCEGLIEHLYRVLLFVLLAATLPLAIWASMRKRQPGTSTFEPVSLSVTLLTLLGLVIGLVFGESLQGSKWIYAETRQPYVSHQTLTLRNNGTFRVDTKEADLNCYFTGRYTRKGDTICLDKSVVDQVGHLLAPRYFVTDTSLIPIAASEDSLKQRGFVIVKRNQ